jgi:hypothetical protein
MGRRGKVAMSGGPPPAEVMKRLKIFSVTR